MTVVSKALTKAGRFFETNGLDGCSKIAACVRDQVLTIRLPLYRSRSFRDHGSCRLCQTVYLNCLAAPFLPIYFQVDEFLPFLPVITGLRTAGMRDRHWDQLSEKLGVDLHPDDNYTLTMYVVHLHTTCRVQIYKPVGNSWGPTNSWKRSGLALSGMVRFHKLKCRCSQRKRHPALIIAILLLFSQPLEPGGPSNSYTSLRTPPGGNLNLSTLIIYGVC